VLRIEAPTAIDRPSGNTTGATELPTVSTAHQAAGGVPVPLADDGLVMHDLSRLGERPFEDLCRALAVHVLGPGIQAFGDGPDGGREATFEGPLAYRGRSGLWNGYGVLQAKYRRAGIGNKDADWLTQQITHELDQWADTNRRRVAAGRRPEYLIIATNIRLSSVPASGGIDRVRTLLLGYADRLGLNDIALWDANTISMYLDSYPQVRQGFWHLISPADVLVKAMTTLEKLDEAFQPRTIKIGQGPAGNERAFRAAYRSAGTSVLGVPTGEVYEDGPGWVQHFSGGPGQPEAVICAQYGHDPVAMEAGIWDALRATGPGQLADAGYPVRSASAAFIDRTADKVTLSGGQWGPGELVCHEDGSWRWQSELGFSFQAREQDRWTSRSDLMDLRLRCAARLLRQNTGLAIDAAGRKRLRSALTADPVVNVVNALATRLGLADRVDGWERTPPDEGPNDQRFASYRCRIAGESGRTALGLWARFQLPDAFQPTIVTLIDLRIDFTALPTPVPRSNGSAIPRLGLDDLRGFFAAAWTTANDHLPLDATTDPREQKPAGPAITEFHLEAEHAFAPADGHPRSLPDLLDLTAFGEPTCDSLPRMSVAVTAPPMATSQIDDVVSDALRHMAAGFGFLEPEDDD
jgi:hypothetical protein